MVLAGFLRYYMLGMKNRIKKNPSPVEANKEFIKDIKKGLGSPFKHLSSKYFYDKKGDQIFQEIMALPEYYLTRSELEALETHMNEFYGIVGRSRAFELIDLGAGDGYKTRTILRYLGEHTTKFTYRPVDISSNAIETLTADLKKEMPEIPVQGISEPFSSALEKLKTPTPKIFLFLGASIGNYTFEESAVFLRKIKEVMNPEDHLLIGFDLRKDPDIILAAYNDASGVTKRFNLNLLERINREMGADFDVHLFAHTPEYNEPSGEARSFLTSLADQTVSIPALDMRVEFENGEKIATEISKKYSLSEIEDLASTSGFTVEKNFMDEKGWFTDSLWKRGAK